VLGLGSDQTGVFWAPYVYWFISDGSKCLVHFCLLIFWFRPSNERGHVSRNWLYSATMFLLYGTTVVGDILMYFNISGCANLVSEIVFFCTWPVVTFFVLQVDSQYWRNVGRPAWSAAASYSVVQRLSRSRSEFERIVQSDEHDPNAGAAANRLSNEHVIDFSRLKILRRIGDKTFNVELLAAFLDGHPVSVKRFHVENLDARTLDACVREITIAACLAPHRNIAAMYGVSLLVPTLCIVCEYAARGTLHTFLRQRLREHQVRRLTDAASHSGSSMPQPPLSPNRHSVNYGSSADTPPPPRSAAARPSRPPPPQRSPSVDERRPLLLAVPGAPVPVSPAPQDDSRFMSSITGYVPDNAPDDWQTLSRLSMGDYAQLDVRGSAPQPAEKAPVAPAGSDNGGSFEDSFFLALGSKLSLARDLACGLAFLHSQRPAIVHSDISSRSCLLANEGGAMRLMLTDFGTTRRLFAADESAVSPRTGSTGCDGDVCAAGVVLHELWTGRVPTSVELAILQQRGASPPSSVSVASVPAQLGGGSGGDVVEAGASLPPTVGVIAPCWIDLMNDCWRVGANRIAASQLDERLQAMRIEASGALTAPAPPPSPLSADSIPAPSHTLLPGN
jgi:hypothetical protein